MAISHLPWLNDAFITFDPDVEDKEAYYEAFLNLCTYYKKKAHVSQSTWSESCQKIYFLFEKELPQIQQIKQSDFLLHLTHSVQLEEIPSLFKEVVYQALNTKNFSFSSDFSAEQNFQQWVTKFFYLTSAQHLHLLQSIPEIFQNSEKKPIVISKEEKGISFTLVNYTQRNIILLENRKLSIDGLPPLSIEKNCFFQLSPCSRTLVFFESLGQLYMHMQDLEDEHLVKKYAFIPHEDKLLFHPNVSFEKAFEIQEKAVQELLKSKKEICRENVVIEGIFFRKFLDTSLDCFSPEKKRESLYGFTVDLRWNEETYKLHTLNGFIFLSQDLGLTRPPPMIEIVPAEQELKRDLQELLTFIPSSSKESYSPVWFKQQIVNEQTGEEKIADILSYSVLDFSMNAFFEPVLNQKRIKNEENIFFTLPKGDFSVILFHYFENVHLIYQGKDKVEWVALIEKEDHWLFECPKSASLFSSLETIGRESLNIFFKYFSTASAENVHIKTIESARFSDRNLGCGQLGKKERLKGFIVQLEYAEQMYFLHTLCGVSFKSPQFEIEETAPLLNFDRDADKLYNGMSMLLNYVPKGIQAEPKTLFRQTLIGEKNRLEQHFEFINYTKNTLFFNPFYELLLNGKEINFYFQSPCVYHNDYQFVLFKYLDSFCLIQKDKKDECARIMILSEEENCFVAEKIDTKTFTNVLEYGSSYLSSQLNRKLSTPIEVKEEEVVLKKIYLHPEIDRFSENFDVYPTIYYVIQAECRGEQQTFQTSDSPFIDYCKYMRKKAKNVPLVDIVATSCIIS